MSTSTTSNDTPNTVSIQIMGKEYHIACPPDQEATLTKAAKNLDQQMRKIRDGGKVVGLERIAIMTALNLSHELILSQTEKVSISEENQEQLSRMNQKLDNTLQRFRQLEL